MNKIKIIQIILLSVLFLTGITTGDMLLPESASVFSVSQSQNETSKNKKYYLLSIRGIESNDQKSLCDDFLKILNSTPYEKIYNDIFLRLLKNRGDFDSIDFKYIENGEEKFGEMPFLKFKMEMNYNHPKNVGKTNPVTMLKEFNEYKKKAGGFDYYLGYADVFKAQPISKKTPVLFYVHKKLDGVSSRPPFDYIIMQDDLSAPNFIAHTYPTTLSPTNFKQMFSYKNSVYILAAYDELAPYITEVSDTLFGCDFKLNK